jgi:hypothetical protein
VINEVQTSLFLGLVVGLLFSSYSFSLAQAKASV